MLHCPLGRAQAMTVENNLAEKPLPVLGCPVLALDEQAAADAFRTLLLSERTGYSVAINAEKIHRFTGDVGFANMLRESVFPYPDGFGATLALKWLHGKKSAKINLPILSLEIANDLGVKVALVGASQESNSRSREFVQKRFPSIDLVYSVDGFADESVILGGLQDTSPRLVLVAMGSPKQEYLAKRILDAGLPSIVVGCGGAFDIMAGVKQRAPEWMVDHGLEWFHRLLKEPRRIFRYRVLVVFFFRLLGAKLVQTATGTGRTRRL